MARRIVVLGFEGEYSAMIMVEDIHKWQEEGLIEVEDAVIAYAGPNARVAIQQTYRSEKGKFALRGGGVGLIAGTLLGGPILGLAVGVTAGVLKGRGKDKAFGLNDEFFRQAGIWVQSGRSALFLLVKQADAEQLRVKLGPLKATVLTITLGPELEKNLRQASAEREYGS